MATAAAVQQLRHEHDALRRSAARLRLLGDAADRSLDIWMPLLEGTLAFLQDGLLRHAAVEEARLFPLAVSLPEVLGTVSLARDHRAIESMTAELNAFREETRWTLPRHLRELRRLAYGLYAVVDVHLTSEDALYAFVP